MISSAQLPKRKERRFVLILGGSMLALIVLVTLFAPARQDDDPRPTTYNSGSAGAKAAYLMLQSLGYRAERWEAPSAGLRDLDAAHTTIVLANPGIPDDEHNAVEADLLTFLDAGGRVLVTGGSGAGVIPDGGIKPSANLSSKLCVTTPEGQEPLAAIGSISMPAYVAWDETDVKGRAQQRCGSDAVVVQYSVGKGTVVWWSSPMPLSNQGLKQDASLKLLLASLGGKDRRILFYESFEGYASSLWAKAKGLPIWALWTQAGLVALLLILSYSRRSGPVRAPIAIARSSPLEFAVSMGQLYQKAGATGVATEGARTRLLRFLHDRCGIPQATPRSSPAEVADAVEARFGGRWPHLRDDLAQAEQALEGRPASPKSALALVRRLDRDLQQVSSHIMKRSTEPEATE